MRVRYDSLDKNKYIFHACRKRVGQSLFLHISTNILPYPLPNMCRKGHSYFASAKHNFGPVIVSLNLIYIYCVATKGLMLLHAKLPLM